jgi:NAD(P)H-dependent FMN reductase
MAVKILGVSGSLRADSYSRKGLDLALSATRGYRVETRLLDLGQTELPMFRPERPVSVNILAVSDSIAWADAFLLATPDYYGSMSGAMKNFLDYHWEQFAGKLFGYLCASDEKGNAAMDQMRTVVRQCYGWSLPYGVTLGRDLAVYGALLRGQFCNDLIERQPDTFAARYAQ